MQVITSSAARADFFRLIDRTSEAHEPVLITSKRNNVVLLSEEDYRAIAETLYLNSIPQMVDTIHEAMNATKEDFTDIAPW